MKLPFYLSSHFTVGLCKKTKVRSLSTLLNTCIGKHLEENREYEALTFGRLLRRVISMDAMQTLDRLWTVPSPLSSECNERKIPTSFEWGTATHKGEIF